MPPRARESAIQRCRGAGRSKEGHVVNGREAECPSSFPESADSRARTGPGPRSRQGDTQATIHGFDRMSLEG